MLLVLPHSPWNPDVSVRFASEVVEMASRCWSSTDTAQKHN